MNERPNIRFFADGEMSRAIQDKDWSQSSVGPIESWPVSLKAVVAMLVANGLPMIVLWGPDFVQIYNAGYRELMGDRHPAGLGQSTWDCWPEVRHLNEPIYARVMTGETVTFEDALFPITRNGRLEDCYFTVSYSPLIDDRNAIAGIMVALVETTERVKLEKRLYSSEQLLVQMFEQGPTFMAVLSEPSHRFQLANRNYKQLIAKQDIIGKSVAEVLPEAVEQGFLAILNTVYKTGEAYVATGAKLILKARRDQPPREIILDFVYQPLRDEKEQVTGIFVVGVDVSERTRTEQALRESEEFNRRVLASSSDCIKVLDLDGKLTFMSEGGMAVMEVSDFNHINGCPWPSFWEDQGHLDAIAALATARTGRSARFLGPANTMAGTPKWWDVVVSPIFGPRGDPEKILVVSRDITETRLAGAQLQKAKDELEAANAGLEQKVAQALHEQASMEEALRQSQKMEAVGQLTGGLAHDFNNLLAVITGSLELLELRVRQGRTSEIDKFVDAAQTASKRAAALTHRLLAFSRRQTLDPKQTSVNLLVAGMHDMIRRTAGPEIEVETILAETLWSTLVDPHQLENALLNLCINARDAMPDGGRITIKTSNQDLRGPVSGQRDIPSGQYVALSVADTGCGMTPDVMARAFEPFFTTKPMGEGTGLGLSMIYGFARQSDGQVRIQSEVGHGATVTIYIPRSQGETKEDNSVAIDRPLHAEHGQTVLIVDDEANIRMLVVEVLESLGYSAIEAPDGPAALRVLQSDARIDLLVTDVGMPGGMNGRQVADAGRVLRPGLKTLFITGYAETTLSHLHLEIGMAIIVKPFSLDALANRIKDMIATDSD